MQLRNPTCNGRAQSLPLWFSDTARALFRLRECDIARAFCPDLRAYSGVAVVQSADMDFMGPGATGWTGVPTFSREWTRALELPAGRWMSYFAEASDPGNEPSHAGPVLVMPPAKQPKPSRRWLQRLWLVVFVLFCLEVGIILTVLPWTRLWTDNSLLISFPSVKEFLNYNFVRGLVSGLGLIDIWMGVVEAVTYRESSRA